MTSDPPSVVLDANLVTLFVFPPGPPEYTVRSRGGPRLAFFSFVYLFPVFPMKGVSAVSFSRCPAQSVTPLVSPHGSREYTVRSRGGPQLAFLS